MKKRASKANVELITPPQTHASLREQMQEKLAPHRAEVTAESIAVAMVEEIADRAASLYEDREYNRIAVDYTAQSLWHEMSLVVQSALIQQDGGERRKEDDITWVADLAPESIECEEHSRRTINIRGNSRPQTGDMGRSNDNVGRRPRRSIIGSAGARNTSGSRPGSSDTVSTLANTRRSVTDGIPSARRRSTTRTGDTASQSPAKTAEPDPVEPEQPAEERTPEELDRIEAARLEEQSKQRNHHTYTAVSQQLADLKGGGAKGVVVDSRLGKVIPVKNFESSKAAGKHGDTGPGTPSRFNVVDESGPAVPQEPHPPRGGPRVSTAPSKLQGGGRRTGRREDNYFVPDQRGALMTINLLPTGGVGVKEGDGIARKADLKMPKNKPSQQDYKRLTAQAAQQVPAQDDLANGIRTEPPPQQQAQTARNVPQPPAQPSSAPATARQPLQKVADQAKQPTNSQNTVIKTGPLPPQYIKSQPTAVKPGPRPQAATPIRSPRVRAAHAVPSPRRTAERRAATAEAAKRPPRQQGGRILRTGATVEGDDEVELE